METVCDRQLHVEQLTNYLFEGDDMLALIMLNGQQPGGRDAGRTTVGFFRNRDQFLDAAEQHNECGNLYVNLNQLSREVWGRAPEAMRYHSPHRYDDADVTRRRALLIDIDPTGNRPKGVNATDDEVRTALDVAKQIKMYLGNLWDVEPLETMSGNGAGLVYLIDEPADSPLVERVLKHLAERFDSPQAKIDTSCSDAARITRLCGTLNMKSESDLETGRLQRYAEVRYVPDTRRVVTTEQLASLKTSKAEVSTATTTTPDAWTHDRIRSMLDNQYRAYEGKGWDYRVVEKPGYGTVYVLQHCPFVTHHVEYRAMVWVKDGHGCYKCFSDDCDGDGKKTFRDLVELIAPDVSTATPRTRERQYRWTEGTEFLEKTFKQDWLIEGLLVENQPHVIGGGTKTLKTMLSLDAGLSIATGGKFLGQYQCKKGPVAFMSAESGEATLQESMRRMLLAKDATLEKGMWHITPDVPWLAGPLDSLEKQLKEWGVVALVIDPLYLAMDGDNANNLFKMGPQLRSIAKMCVANGITPIVNHHATRQAGRDNAPVTLNDLQWSGIAEFFRQWWLVNRTGDFDNGRSRLFLSAGGSSGMSHEMYLTINEGKMPVEESDPPRVWQVEIKTGDEVAAIGETTKYHAFAAKVVAALKGAKEPLPQGKLCRAVGCNNSVFKEHRDKLIADGILVPTPETANDKYPKWQHLSGEPTDTNGDEL
jgi:hypothetical protein